MSGFLRLASVIESKTRSLSAGMSLLKDNLTCSYSCSTSQFVSQGSCHGILLPPERPFIHSFPRGDPSSGVHLKFCFINQTSISPIDPLTTSLPPLPIPLSFQHPPNQPIAIHPPLVLPPASRTIPLHRPSRQLHHPHTPQMKPLPILTLLVHLAADHLSPAHVATDAEALFIRVNHLFVAVDVDADLGRVGC